MHTESVHCPGSASKPDWLELVRAQVTNLRYGVIQLVVHNGRVTQIERTEKLRLADDQVPAQAPARTQNGARPQPTRGS